MKKKTKKAVQAEKTPVAEWLTVDEAAREFGRSVRSVRRDIARGLPTRDGEATGWHGRGQRKILIARAEYRKWMAGQDGKQAQKTAAAAASASAVDAEDASEAAEVATAVAEALKDAGPGAHELDDMYRRLVAMERGIYADMVAMRTRLARHPEAGVAARSLAEAWGKLCQTRRQVEKDLPEILYRKARFVDALKVGELLTGAVTGMAAELDQVGMRVAEACVGKTAREIRILIDTAVQESRAQVHKTLEALCQPTA
jgi:DNA-directed RNA polymerase specialized sigma54-like protein